MKIPDSPQVKRTSEGPTSGIFRRTWEQVTLPADSVTSLEDRRQARLMASFMLTLTLLTVTGVVSGLVSEPTLDAALSTQILLAFVCAGAYVISRSRYFPWASVLAVSSIGAFPFGLFIVSGDYSDLNTIRALLWSLIALLLANIFFHIRGIIISLGIMLLALIALAVFIPEVTFEKLFVILTFAFITGVLSLVNLAYRSQLEASRQAELTNANRELQSLATFLETRVANRTQDLALAADVGRTISQVRELDLLLADAVKLIRARFELYYVQIYLTDSSEGNLVLRVGTGTVGKELVSRGHQLRFGSGSINGLAAGDKRAVVVPDTAASPIFRPNQLLPDTRSEIAVPLLIGERVVGVLDLQSARVRSLNNDNVAAFEILAGQLAVAIENAALFSERSRAENELLRFRLGIERSSHAVFLTEIDGTIVYVNPAFEKMYGYSKEEAVGQTPRILKSGALSKEVYQYFWNSLLAKNVVSGEIVNKTKQGKLIHVDGSNNPIINEEGEIVGFLGLHSDITQRKQAEQELHLLGSVAEQTLEGLMVTDLEGVVQFVNASWSRMHGYDSQELLGKHLSMFHTQQQMQEEMQPLNIQATRTGGNQGEVGHLRKDGSTFLTWTTTGLLKDANNKPAGLVISAQDITESKRAEDALARRAAELGAVADVSTAVASTSDTQELLQIAADYTKASFDLYHTHIYLIDEHENELVLAAGAGEVGRRMVMEGRRISLFREQSLVSRAARNRVGVIVNNVKAEPGFLPHPLLPDTASEMAVPLIAGDQLLGVLDVQSDQVDRFTGEDVNIQATLAAQIAVALQNASRHQQTQAALDELNALQRAVTREGWQAFMTAKEHPIIGFLADQTAVRPIPHSMASTNGQNTADDGLTTLEKVNFLDESAVVAPLAVRGEIVGGLGVRVPAEQLISAEDHDLLQSISRQVAQALERARLAEQTGQALSATEEHARRLAMLNRMSEQLNRAPSFEDIFDIAVEQIANMLMADQVTLAMVTRDGDAVQVMARHGESGDYLVGDLIPIAPDSSFVRAITDAGVVVLPGSSEERTSAIRSLIMAPLSGEKKIIGTINIGSKKPQAFSTSDNNLVLQIAAILGATIERRLLAEQAQARAERERILQAITARVSGSADVDTVMRTAVEEIGRALGRRAFVYLGDRKTVSQPSGPENGA